MLFRSLGRVQVRDVRPDDREPALSGQGRELVDVLELLRVRLVRGDELAHRGVGLLEVDVDDPTTNVRDVAP